MEFPCENCVVLAMCLNKSVMQLIGCKLLMEYMHNDDVYQKHSRLSIVKTFFSKHNISTKLINTLIQDIEEFMDYQRKRNSNV